MSEPAAKLPEVPLWPDLVPDLQPWIGEVRGRLIPNQPLSEVTWFRVGGPAQLFFQPADEDDLAFFLKHLPEDIRVTVIGLGSNLLIRDGGLYVGRTPRFDFRATAGSTGSSSACRPADSGRSRCSTATACVSAPRCRT